MAEDGMGWFSKDQSERGSLRETLQAQQKLLQKLYNELEVEREASSTAASEALSMILRLQGEKAAVKMEAEQYKRLVEEKMCHAEESLSIFEDLIYQKEMEVASLDYQVQAYRYKLISMGCPDPGIGEIKFPENLLQRNEDVTSSQIIGRRLSSPRHSLKRLNLKKGLFQREDSTSPDRDLITYRFEDREGKEVTDQGSDNVRSTANSSVANINSYSEQIRRLDDKVKEVAGVNLRSSTSSPLPLSQFSSENSSEAMSIFGLNETDQAKSRRDSSDSEMNNDSNDTPGVLDVFEVPQADPDKKLKGKTVLFAADDLIKRSDSIPEVSLKPEVKFDIEWLKNLLLSDRERILSRHSENAIVSNVAIVKPTARVGVCQPNSIQRTRTAEIIQVGSQASRDVSSGGGEALILLSEIKEQLNTIQSEIISLKTKSSALKENQAMVSYMETSLMEEMVGFWL